MKKNVSVVPGSLSVTKSRTKSQAFKTKHANMWFLAPPDVLDKISFRALIKSSVRHSLTAEIWYIVARVLSMFFGYNLLIYMKNLNLEKTGIAARTPPMALFTGTLIPKRLSMKIRAEGGDLIFTVSVHWALHS